jgi:hypothetical protein
MMPHAWLSVFTRVKGAASVCCPVAGETADTAHHDTGKGPPWGDQKVPGG